MSLSRDHLVKAFSFYRQGNKTIGMYVYSQYPGILFTSLSFFRDWNKRVAGRYDVDLDWPFLCAFLGASTTLIKVTLIRLTMEDASFDIFSFLFFVFCLLLLVRGIEKSWSWPWLEALPPNGGPDPTPASQLFDLIRSACSPDLNIKYLYIETWFIII